MQVRLRVQVSRSLAQAQEALGILVGEVRVVVAALPLPLARRGARSAATPARRQLAETARARHLCRHTGRRDGVGEGALLETCNMSLSDVTSDVHAGRFEARFTAP